MACHMKTYERDHMNSCELAIDSPKCKTVMSCHTSVSLAVAMSTILSKSVVSSKIWYLNSILRSFSHIFHSLELDCQCRR